MSNRAIRILLAKVGLDGHDRGIVTISQWLRDAGMEVIYLGSFQTTDTVIKTAMDEDVDVIGLSFLGGEHLFYVAQMMKKLQEARLDVPLIVGGIIPKPDIPQLEEMGVKGVFPAGTPMETIVARIKELSGAERGVTA